MSILTQATRRFLSAFAGRAFNAVLPASCVLCGADAKAGPLCSACESDLPGAPATQCPICGIGTTHGERCGACLKQPPHFDWTVAEFAYAFPADRLVHALKYGHQLAIAPWFGKRLGTALQAYRFDAVIPLPLHPERLIERGFNQSAEIGAQIARECGVPLNRQSLIRSRATRPQAELAPKQRRKNVRGAFECRVDYSGRRLLLVDDVMTTGATADECARVLKLHGAEEVGVAVVARALRHGG